MSQWKQKRFWSTVTTTAQHGGFGIALDGKPVSTPARATLVVPTQALADLIAAEWEAQQGTVDPREMPFTRMANSAIDKVLEQKGDVAAIVGSYGGTDLLCYRAATPPALVARQVAGWNPVLDWAAEAYGAQLAVGQGVMPVAQSDEAVSRLTARVNATTHFELTALHDLVALSGSLVLGVAVADGWIDGSAAWALSRIDEDWQAEIWGHDDDADSVAALKFAAFLDAERFYRLCSTAVSA